MATRAELISELKRKGVSGKLSKMTKRELEKLLHGGGTETRRPQLSLEDEEQESPAPRKQKALSPYHAFVKQNIHRHGGDMKAVAAAYREQQGGAGFVRDVGKKAGKALGNAAVGLTEGLYEAAKETIAGEGDDAYADVSSYMSGGSNAASHDQFMDATHSYCESRDEEHNDDVDDYMEGGKFAGGSWNAWQIAGTVAQIAGMAALAFVPGGAAADAGIAAAEAGGEAAVGTVEAATQTAAELEQAGETTAQAVAKAGKAADGIAGSARAAAKAGEIPAAEARTAEMVNSFGSSTSEEAEEGASSLLSRAAARSDAAAEAGEAGSSSTTAEAATQTADRTAATATEDTSTTENPLTSKAKKWNSSWVKSAKSVGLSDEDVEELRVAASKEHSVWEKAVGKGKKAASDAFEKKFGVKPSSFRKLPGEGTLQWSQRMGGVFSKMAAFSAESTGQALSKKGDIVQDDEQSQQIGQKIEDARKASDADYRNLSNAQQRILAAAQRGQSSNLASQWQRYRDRNPYG
eukprot:COSAG05_NODE_306_length_11691_cov_14.764665_3_plen_521_part_00